MMVERDRLLAFQVLPPDEAELMLALVNVILPHGEARLEEAKFATALALDAKLVADLSLRAAVREGLTGLERSAWSGYGERFGALGMAEQAELCSRIEDGPFFQTMVQLVKYDFYNRHIVWEVIGYPDLGNDSGYLHLGFDRFEVADAMTARHGKAMRSGERGNGGS